MPDPITYIKPTKEAGVRRKGSTGSLTSSGPSQDSDMVALEWDPVVAQMLYPNFLGEREETKT